MGNHIALTVDGKHQKGRKLFITDGNGKHRKVKKGFLTVGGVHRLVFAAGYDWAKYNCIIAPAHYREIGGGESDFGTYAAQTMTLYDSYDFTESGGYFGEGAHDYFWTDDLSSAVGKYLIDEEEVLQITSLSKATSGGFIDWAGNIVARCELVENAYSKGSTSYGKIFSDEGELPEAGTLIEGSIAEGYCILEVDGVKYYYEMV